MKTFSLLVLLVAAFRLFAQTGPIIEVSAPGSGPNYGNVNITNNSEIGVMKNIEVDERNINGSPFWRNEWNQAIVIFSAGNSVALKQAKLNLNTGEIYFLDSSGTVKAAAMNFITKIVFTGKTDSLKTLGVFEKMMMAGSTAFFQVLNTGKVELLKTTRVMLIKKEYDAALEKDNYSYSAKSTYYISRNGTLSELNGFHKNQLTELISMSKDDDSWLVANKNKLKNEKEMVEFLDFYNKEQ